MRVWLIEVGEILPIDDGGRVMRTGLLAKSLLEQGHEVVWWADAFNHMRKTFRAPSNKTVPVSDGFTLELLHGPPYSKNVSYARLKNQRVVAQQFEALAPQRPRPDVIYCGYPTIELAYAASKFAKQNGIPFLVDVRDPWPELFLEVVPRPLRWAARLALSRQYREGRAALRAASVLTAMSEPCMQWALDFSKRQKTSAEEIFYLAYERDAALKPVPVNLDSGGQPVRLRALFVGTFGPAYDLTTLVDAARILEQKNISGIQFVLAGDGPQAADLKTRAKGLRSIVFTGWIDNGQIRYLLDCSHAGLVAIAGMAITAVPNKSFEYMSGGLAMLNSTTADLKHLVDTEKIGLNYTSGDPKTLAAQIEWLLNHPQELKEFQANSRALFQRRFEAGNVYASMARKLTALSRPSSRTEKAESNLVQSR